MNNLRLIIIAALAFVAAGCSNYFETYPPKDYYEHEVFEDIARAQQFLNSAYSGISITPNYALDFYTDNAVSTWGAKSAAVAGATTESCAVSGEWDKAIKWIMHINEFLEKGLEVDYDSFDAEYAAKLKTRITGEAYGLRAYYKWILLKNFAGPSANDKNVMLGIPIIDKAVSLKEANSIARATYMDSYDSINADIEEALKYITFMRYSGADDIAGEQFTGRISGEMLYALRARMALFAASEAFKQISWEDALAVISESIAKIDGDALVDLTAYVTVNESLIIYDDYNNTTNKDHLWRSVFKKGKDVDLDCLPPSLFGLGNCNPTQELVNAFPSINGQPYTGSDVSSPIYSTRDDRFAQFIFHNGQNNFRTKSADIELFEGGKDASGGMRIKGSRTGYYMKKFMTSLLNLDPTATSATTSAYKFSVVFDRSGLYLDFAEAALNALGDAKATNDAGISAYDAITKVRAKAGIVDDTYIDTIVNDNEKFMDMIINERRLEMCFTGERYYDVRRLKLSTEYLSSGLSGVQITKNSDGLVFYEPIAVENRYFAENMYYNPIPASQINKSDALIQNFGW